MFFRESQIQKTQAWKYGIGLLIFLIGYFIGQLPLVAALYYRLSQDPSLGEEELEAFMSNPNFELFGIDSNLGFILLILMFAVALGLLLLFIKYGHNRPLLSVINPKLKIDWSKIIWAFLLWVFLGLILEGFNYFMSPDSYSFQFEAGSFVVLFLLAILVLPIQTTAEEILFRGYLMHAVGTFAQYKWIPLVLTSLAFGAIHMFNPEIAKYGMGVMQAYYISAGIILGVMTIMDDSLELAIGVHAATNFFAAVILSYEGSAIQTDALFRSSEINPSMVFLFFVIQGVIFLAICSWKYDWAGFSKILEKIESEYEV